MSLHARRQNLIAVRQRRGRSTYRSSGPTPRRTRHQTTDAKHFITLDLWGMFHRANDILDYLSVDNYFETGINLRYFSGEIPWLPDRDDGDPLYTAGGRLLLPSDVSIQ